VARDRAAEETVYYVFGSETTPGLAGTGIWNGEPHPEYALEL